MPARWDWGKQTRFGAPRRSEAFEPPARRTSRSTDSIADIGIWVVRHVPGAGPSKDPGGFVYERLGLGTFRLSQALRLHWLFAYLFMANGLLYVRDTQTLKCLDLRR